MLTDRELRQWLGRYRQDIRYDGESPPYGHAATKWARSLCGDIVRMLVRRDSAQRVKEPPRLVPASAAELSNPVCEKGSMNS